MEHASGWDREMARDEMIIAGKHYQYVSLRKLEEQGFANIDRLPFTIRLLLECAVRHADGQYITDEHIAALANWRGGNASQEVPFKPARIVFQDFTGIPAIVDLASMRDAVAAGGGNPALVNPQIPVDLVIDHSVIIEHAGSEAAYEKNLAIEYGRNEERYQFVRWAQKSFENFHVVPPANGIVHQVNLEYLARCSLLQDYLADFYLYHLSYSMWRLFYASRRNPRWHQDRRRMNTYQHNPTG